MKKQYIWMGCVVMLLFSALACNSIPFLAPTPTPTATPTSTPTPTPTNTPTPTGIPGITMPITVEGIDFQFFSVTTAGHWMFGTSDYTPKSSLDNFLIVKANVLTSGTAYSTIKDWDVTVNGSIAWVFNQSGGALTSIDTMTWVFIVSKSASSFTLNFPSGEDVVLNSLY